jgi:hypothetical protein
LPALDILSDSLLFVSVDVARRECEFCAVVVVAVVVVMADVTLCSEFALPPLLWSSFFLSLSSCAGCLVGRGHSMTMAQPARFGFLSLSLSLSLFIPLPPLLRPPVGSHSAVPAPSSGMHV